MVCPEASETGKRGQVLDRQGSPRRLPVDLGREVSEVRLIESQPLHGSHQGSPLGDGRIRPFHDPTDVVGVCQDLHGEYHALEVTMRKGVAVRNVPAQRHRSDRTAEISLGHASELSPSDRRGDLVDEIRGGEA